MGNISQKSVQSSDESLKTIEKIFTQTQDSGSLDYQSKLQYIFWRKDANDNVIIGTIDGKNTYMKFNYDFKGKNQNSLENIYERKNWNEFKESLIQVQDAEKITVDRTLNDFITDYQLPQNNNPQDLIKSILQKDIIIEKDPKNQDQNSNEGKRSTSYSFCFNNYINQSQVIFEKSDKRDNISFDWKGNQAQIDSKQFIYKHSIQLKIPLKDKNEIKEKCSSYESVKEFLENEKS